VDILQSYGKKNFAQFFETRCIYPVGHKSPPSYYLSEFVECTQILASNDFYRKTNRFLWFQNFWDKFLKVSAFRICFDRRTL